MQQLLVICYLQMALRVVQRRAAAAGLLQWHDCSRRVPCAVPTLLAALTRLSHTHTRARVR
jgi:hypothetical protein